MVTNNTTNVADFWKCALKIVRILPKLWQRHQSPAKAEKECGLGEWGKKTYSDQNKTQLGYKPKRVRSMSADKFPSRCFHQLPCCPVPSLPSPKPWELMGNVRKEKVGSLRTLVPRGMEKHSRGKYRGTRDSGVLVLSWPGQHREEHHGVNDAGNLHQVSVICRGCQTLLSISFNHHECA